MNTPLPLQRVILVAFAVYTLRVTGCTASEPLRPTPAPATAPTAAARLVEPTTPAVAAVRPAVEELARRAEANDTAYFGKRMGDATAEQVADMIARVKRSDVPGTYPRHLAVRGTDAAGLNYHDPSHVQVELKKDAAGNWDVARLWFCR